MEGHQPEVLVVDDRLAIGRGMELLLRGEGFAVAVCAERPDRARTRLVKGRHHVALVEIRRNEGDGIELAREAMEAGGAPLVLCTAHASPRGPLLAASRLEAPGLVLTSSAVATLVQALRAVAGGARFVDPAAARALAATPAEARVARLTPRERQILELLADGYQGPEIAERLFLSLETVRTHIRNAMAKLGARTRVQAAAMVACARGEG
jgi:DNA-binding NarL/FixJ family response regulator